MDTLRPLPSDLVELRNLRSLLGDLRHQLAASIGDADHKFSALTSFKHKRPTMDLASIVIGDTPPPSAILRLDELVPYLPTEHTQFIAEFLKQAAQREQLREQRELDLAMSGELAGKIAEAVAAGMNGDDARHCLSRLFSYHGHERDLAELSVGLSMVREAIIALENRVCHELDARATAEQAGALADQAPDDDAYVLVSSLWSERFPSKRYRSAEAKAILDTARIRYRKPQTNRLEVHAADWARYWADRDRRAAADGDESVTGDRVETPMFLENAGRMYAKILPKKQGRQ